MIGAIDIGGTKIAVGVIGSDGQVRSRRDVPTEAEAGFPRALAKMTALLRDAQAEAGGKIDGIGIGATGPVDPFRGTIEDAGLLPGWRGAPIGPRLAEAFGVETALENDADAASLAEATWGIGRGAECFLYVTISTGIGAGIVRDRKLFRGAKGAHPELGHIALDHSGGPQCYCGLKGCWESLASGPALEAWYRAQAEPGTPAAGPEEICRRAGAGEPLARRALAREAEYVGLGLVNLVTSFCPDVIALGGGVAKSAGLFLDQARDMVRRLATQVPATQTRIEVAALGNDVGLIGAGGAWLHRVGRLPL
ncbi:MAG: ROK family protein [Opitutaceae bacterium]